MPLPGSALPAFARMPGETRSVTAIIHLLSRDGPIDHCSLSSCDTHQQEIEQADDQPHHEEYGGGCHSRRKVEGGTSEHKIVGIRCYALHLVSAEYVEEIEDAKGSERAEEERDDHRLGDHGQGNRPELLEAATPIDTGSFVQFIRNDLKASQDQESHKRRGFPDIGDDGSGNNARTRLQERATWGQQVDRKSTRL